MNLFNKIEYRLNGIYQNLIHQMNNNNDKNLDLMDPILFKMNTFRGCKLENSAQQLKDIKRQLINNETKMTEIVKRLEIFERNFENLLKPDLKNITALVTLSDQIDMQLNIQADKLHKFNEHFSGLQKTSIINAN
ncbi:hypothetical protein DOY81_009286 [Sarcophaga bullata]|nr:hypothetical protein DOY81_009286 [Sarcophaga bullata]